MNQAVLSAVGILIPFLGTALGAAAVFFVKKELSEKTQKAFLGFASGVMLAASVWSLLIPAMEHQRQLGGIHWLPAVVGFLAGNLAMVGLDILCSNFTKNRGKDHSPNTMLTLAVTLHNLPEGMAVGVVWASVSDFSLSGLTGALMLSLGIAVQNLPEGAIISAPLFASGSKKSRAFALGAASGIVEPLGAGLTLALTSVMRPILPYVLSFAAGTMVYVVFEELSPEMQKGSRGFCGVLGLAAGFGLMMLLDAALG
ncbi:MAG: ZIP family metal transporter [Clostridia bacterium]|nr:ZIP family metal transporter [Clostridia bacterium]